MPGFVTRKRLHSLSTSRHKYPVLTQEKMAAKSPDVWLKIPGLATREMATKCADVSLKK